RWWRTASTAPGLCGGPMTADTKTMLDIVRRIAAHLKGEDEPRGMSAGEPRASARGSRGARPQGRRGVGERGFTLPEMLITAVLVGGAAALIATAIYQVFIVAQDGNARLAVLGDMENAAIWIGRDSSESASWSAGSGTVYGTLTTSDPNVQYRYSYDAATSSLVREHLVAGSPVSTLSIARRIANQGDVSFSLAGTLLTVSLTGTSGPTSESATLKLGMRVK
ncbi:MAG: type II secretion system protein J, partial [Anaerolineales bacterium]